MKIIKNPLSLLALLGMVVVAGIPLLGGCNDYPLQVALAQNITVVTDSQPQLETKQVDILFVIDNSGSMEEEQKKLSRNFKSFINELLTKQINDFHIGIITTDMDSCQTDCGKLRGTPKILNKNMSPKEIRDAFTNNAVVGTGGSPYEKGLDAVQAALSKPLIDDPTSNQGFLRPDALLAVIFITDENDCSHNGTIPESELHSEVCHVPPSEVVLGPDGKPRIDSKGNKVMGYMDRLTPTSKYVQFLKSLNRKIIAAGLIGDPVVYKPNPNDPTQKKLVPNAAGICSSDNECQVGSTPHKCIYANANDASKKRCGGCKSTDADAVPGFRYHTLFDEFGGGENWFPICGDDAGFVKALLRFAGLIIETLNYVVLSKPPENPNSMAVQILPKKGQPVIVPKAMSLSTKCTVDNDCGAGQQEKVCGADSTCYGDGWVYFPPATSKANKARIKLSGRYKKLAVPGSEIKVVYITK